MRNERPWWCCLVAVAMLGCSPTMNWRAARLDPGSLQMLMPCKPDKASRNVSMGGRTLALSMQGCDAGGATFAASHVLAPYTGVANELLAGWRQAVLAHVHASAVQSQPFEVQGGWSTPHALRMQAVGRKADGTEIIVYASWFASVDGAGVHVFHAVVLASRPMPEAAETYFASLALR